MIREESCRRTDTGRQSQLMSVERAVRQCGHPVFFIKKKKQRSRELHWEKTCGNSESSESSRVTKQTLAIL